MNAKKVCLVIAVVCFTFAAFGFSPFGNFDFGWAGAAILALGLCF